MRTRKVKAHLAGTPLSSKHLLAVCTYVHACTPVVCVLCTYVCMDTTYIVGMYIYNLVCKFKRRLAIYWHGLARNTFKLFFLALDER